jgi:5-deoxy-D-glucuronate isomerase
VHDVSELRRYPIHCRASLLKWHRQVNEIESQSSEWQYTNLRVFDVDRQAAAAASGRREVCCCSSCLALLAKEACFHLENASLSLYQSIQE